TYTSRSGRNSAECRGAGGCGGGALSLETVRALMSRHVGVLRDEDGLRTAERALEPHLDDDHALTAWLITRAARRRRASCGGHRRGDAPSAARAPEGALA
ncbi:MAG TPA: hypothetical protein VFJ12_02585, partial [Segeticoccus sp.]|nr:hypothetical protein [Segeticoccus sp.]